MFHVKLMCVSVLACVTLVTYTAESIKPHGCLTGTREYCIHSTCQFSKENELENEIDGLALPSEDRWISRIEFDHVDDKIYKGIQYIAYKHDDIESLSHEFVKIMAKNYKDLHGRAQKYFTNRKTILQTSLNYMIKDTGKEAEILKTVITRIDYYIKLMDSIEKFDHMCPGAIVSKAAVMCIKQAIVAQEKEQSE